MPIGETQDWFARPRAVRLSAASGLMWGLLAWFIAHRAFGNRIWSGVVVAPLIGIVIGVLSRPLGGKPRWAQLAGSLVYLYVAAVCFAVGTALSSPVLGPRNVRVSAALIQDVLGVLWGLTVAGWALVLWPLSFYNHRLVWQADEGRLPAPPEIRTTSPVVRRLAVRISALAVLGYLAFTLFHTVAARVGWSPSTTPAFNVTSLMSWGNWFVLGILIWLSAPVLAFGATCAGGCDKRSIDTYSELLGVVGFAVIAFPMLFFAATLVVTAIKVTLVHSWATEGTVLRASYYYRNVFHAYLPWLFVGGGMIAVRRLLVGRS